MTLWQSSFLTSLAHLQMSLVGDFRFWPLADMTVPNSDVRFRG